MASLQSVLFYRDFRRVQGGHLKVWEYFNHVRATPGFEARIHFSPQTLWDETNPWFSLQQEAEPTWNPGTADCIFLGGMDWAAVSLPLDGKRPIINFIQHVRHADPANPLSQFLSRRAVRICVSREVEAAIRATGKVNGPIFTIPNGVDLGGLSQVPTQARDIPLLIAALKQPEWGRELRDRLKGTTGVHLQRDRIPRPDFLQLLARAQVTLFLPGETEGFYLPALEGMALGTLVVCPDAIGNRGFCIDGETAWMPPNDLESILAATQKALALTEADRLPMLERARAKAAEHDLANERSTFQSLLRKIPNLWLRDESSL